MVDGTDEIVVSSGFVRLVGAAVIEGTNPIFGCANVLAGPNWDHFVARKGLTKTGRNEPDCRTVVMGVTKAMLA